MRTRAARRSRRDVQEGEPLNPSLLAAPSAPKYRSLANAPLRAKGSAPLRDLDQDVGVGKPAETTLSHAAQAVARVPNSAMPDPRASRRDRSTLLPKPVRASGDFEGVKVGSGRHRVSVSARQNSRMPSRMTERWKGLHEVRGVQMKGSGSSRFPFVAAALAGSTTCRAPTSLPREPPPWGVASNTRWTGQELPLSRAYTRRPTHGLGSRFVSVEARSGDAVMSMILGVAGRRSSKRRRSRSGTTLDSVHGASRSTTSTPQAPTECFQREHEHERRAPCSCRHCGLHALHIEVLFGWQRSVSTRRRIEDMIPDCDPTRSPGVASTVERWKSDSPAAKRRRKPNLTFSCGRTFPSSTR
jgi:hypothetical protein